MEIIELTCKKEIYLCNLILMALSIARFNYLVFLVDAVPEEIRNLDRKLEEAQDKSTRVALLNENIQRNISSIRKLIEDARRKAASVNYFYTKQK